MKNRICLITGANSELATAIIERFLNDYHLILCWHDSCERIKEYLSLDDVDSFCGDLQHEKQCEFLMRQLHEKYSHIDVVINCIGKNVHSADITEEIWDDVIATNLKPAFFIGKYYWKYFYETDNKKYNSCMIHISSTAGIRPIPSSPHYVVAKAGLIALSDYFAKVMAPYVRVNTIAPGFVATGNHCSSAYDDIIKKIPMKRMASIDEVAQTAEYLVECAYITAQTIVVDGGMIS